jgi:hypothetical protein
MQQRQALWQQTQKTQVMVVNPARFADQYTPLRQMLSFALF